MVYHVPDEDGKLSKKKDEYECAEVEALMKTFSGIRNKTVGLGLIEDFTTVSGAAKNLQRRGTLDPRGQRGGRLDGRGEEESKKERSGSQ